jgi:hypothetical protein
MGAQPLTAPAKQPVRSRSGSPHADAGLEVNQIFRLVHDEVLAATDKQQQPFTYGQLPAEQFYFKQWGWRMPACARGESF